MINPFSLLSLTWQNYFDILLVAILIYSVYIWLRGTRAFHILIGLAGLGMMYFLASWSGLLLTSWLLQYLLGVILLLAIVIFQPEIRQLLEKVSPLAIIKLKGGIIPREVLTEVSEACFRLADQRIGALIVFPRATPVNDVIQEGTPLDSITNQELLLSIFQRNSPIHDGAVIIEKDRIVKAACYLPLSTREGLPPKYGTRHRAALGLSEQTDSLCLIVSEERGTVSVAQGGEIETITGEDILRQRLENTLSPPSTAPSSMRASFRAAIYGRLNFQEFARKNFSAKILALGLSCLLWVLLVGQQWSETFTTATLEYQNIPKNLDIISNAASEVMVRVRGPRGSISTLRPDQIRVLVNLSDAKVGKNTIPITDKNISLPFGLEVTSVVPRALSLEFDRIVSRRFSIVLARAGALPEGLRLDSIDIEPTSLELSGPLTKMEQIQRITTVPPVDLSTITRSQTITRQVQIIPPLSASLRGLIPDVMVTLNVSPILPEQPAPDEADTASDVTAEADALPETEEMPLGQQPATETMPQKNP